MEDEADRYIASLIEGTEYAKQKDHEARLRMIAKYYGVSMDDAHAIQKALFLPIRGLIQEAVASNAEEIVRAFVRLCQTPRPDGAPVAEKPTPANARSERRE